MYCRSESVNNCIYLARTTNRIPKGLTLFLCACEKIVRSNPSHNPEEPARHTCLLRCEIFGVTANQVFMSAVDGWLIPRVKCIYFPTVILNMLFIGHYYSTHYITHLHLSSSSHVFTLFCTKRAHSKRGVQVCHCRKFQ